jgi:hypothetical protein
MSRPSCDNHFCLVEVGAPHTLGQETSSACFDLRHERLPGAVQLRLAVRGGGSDKECMGMARPPREELKKARRAVPGYDEGTNLGSLPRADTNVAELRARFGIG